MTDCPALRMRSSSVNGGNPSFEGGGQWEKRGDDGGYTQYLALVEGADVILNPRGAPDHVDFKKGATVFTKDLDIFFSIFNQVST